jgi:predicted metalloendopeptidase
MGFARSWRSKMTEAGLRAYVASDSHAPDNNRIATVRNIDAWYEALRREAGAAPLPSSEARVRVW